MYINKGINSSLDEKTEQLNSIPEFLTHVAREEIEKLSEISCECNVIFIAQLGYLLAIPTSQEVVNNSMMYNGLELKFVNKSYAHYKNERMRKLDEELGDINKDINDIQLNILHQLENTILKKYELLGIIADIVAELDCLIALSISAKEFALCKPLITNKNIICIENGRHLLQEICTTQIVPNSTYSTEDEGNNFKTNSIMGNSNMSSSTKSSSVCHDSQNILYSSINDKNFLKNSLTKNDCECELDKISYSNNGKKVKIITGAHGSGKSIYLKQIGLIVFMAHIGSFVPASLAEIGVIDQIFTRIYSYDSVSLNYSMFMMDISKVSQAINNGTEKSLVLLDEIGKGTIPEDGLALLTGIVNYFSEKNRTPFIFIITHFLDIRKYLSHATNIQFQTMEVIVDTLKNEMIYLYQVKDGFVENNYLKILAKTLNFPESIIERTLEHNNLFDDFIKKSLHLSKKSRICTG
ncbi:unnamed protein product [Gordionus sp. m RMFG-2023]